MFLRQKNFEYYNDEGHLIGIEAQHIQKGYDTKDLKQLFQQYMEDDEHLISSFGNGRSDKDNSGISKKITVFIIIGLLLTVSAIVLGIFFDVISESSVFKIMFLGFFGIPAAAALFHVICGSKEKDYNYAVTDRRVLAISEAVLFSIPFDGIQCTTVRGEKVSLYIKTRRDRCFVYNIVSNGSNPQQVKNIIDDARHEHWKHKKEVKNQNMTNTFQV